MKKRRKGETGKAEEGSKRHEARGWNAEEKGGLRGKGENALRPSLAIRYVKRFFVP